MAGVVGSEAHFPSAAGGPGVGGPVAIGVMDSEDLELCGLTWGIFPRPSFYYLEWAYLLALQAPVLPRDWSVRVVFDTLLAGESGKGEARLCVRRASEVLPQNCWAWLLIAVIAVDA